MKLALCKWATQCPALLCVWLATRTAGVQPFTNTYSIVAQITHCKVVPLRIELVDLFDETSRLDSMGLAEHCVFTIAILYGMHQKKWCWHSECFSEMRLRCSSRPNQKASSENRRFLPKKGRASSEECWVRIHIGFWNEVQLHLRTFRGRVCAFWSCISNGKAEQQWKDFHKRASFLKTRTICRLDVREIHDLETLRLLNSKRWYIDG